MLAASAAAGAPLGHDFCAINLSDNLKPWSIIERRLRHAARGDFAMAFYNPRSKSRPEGFAKTLEILNQECADSRPILFCRNVSRPDQTITCLPLNEATPDMADMRTLVIVGTSHRGSSRAKGCRSSTPRAITMRINSGQYDAPPLLNFVFQILKKTRS